VALVFLGMGGSPPSSTGFRLVSVDGFFPAPFVVTSYMYHVSAISIYVTISLHTLGSVALSLPEVVAEVFFVSFAGSYRVID
jgi:hypothetical protein